MTDTITSEPTETVKRGRKPSFDRQAAIEATAALFWDKGYEGVSLSNIMDATGLSKSSLYNSFGDKDAIFASALAFYGDSVVRSGAAWLAAEDGSDPMEKLDQLLSGPIQRAHSDRDLRGCFLCNTAADGKTDVDEIDDLVGDGFSILEDGVLALLKRQAPDRPDTDLRPLARLILTTYIGLNVRSRQRPSRQTLDTTKSTLVDLIRSQLG